MIKGSGFPVTHSGYSECASRLETVDFGPSIIS